MKQITPQELRQRIERGERVALLDVREAPELQLAALPGATLLPMSELARRVCELDPDVEWIVFCHHGIRSVHVIAHLEQQGFSRLVNLRGGIDAWSREVDPKVPRY